MKLQQLNIYQSFRRLFVRRKYKDFLFQRVFRDKKDLLDLYNALNGTSYDNPDDIDITTLEDAIYLSVKNDLSFIIASSLNLYEHQSTINPNMPLRSLIYFAKLYQAYVTVNKLNIYGKQKIMLPMPQCVVFYNGRDDMPDDMVLRLTDMFAPVEGIEPALESVVRVININYGHNKELLDSCKRLRDYSFFIERINKNVDSGMNIEDAIREAIDYCIKNDVLEDILLKNSGEVFDMLLTKYDKKLHERTLFEEGREEGREEGYTDGYASRQGEVDELKTLVLFKDDEISAKDEILSAKNEQLAEMAKKLAELEAKLEEQEKC